MCYFVLKCNLTNVHYDYYKLTVLTVFGLSCFWFDFMSNSTKASQMEESYSHQLRGISEALKEVSFEILGSISVAV